MKDSLKKIVAAVLIVGVVGCTSAPTQTVASLPPGLSVQDGRVSGLLSLARAAAEKGDVLTSLRYYGSVANQGHPAAETATEEVVHLLDTLTLAIVAGDRQVAAAGSRQIHPFQVHATYAPNGNTVGVGRLPVKWQWLKGDGLVTGEHATDANGFVTLRVDSLDAAGEAVLEIAVNVGELKSGWGVPYPGLDVLTQDGFRAMEGRTVRFRVSPGEIGERTRILVLIDEEVLGSQMQDSFLADRLTTSLVARGLRVVGNTEIGKSHTQKLEQSLDRNELISIRDELFGLCKYILYGRVSVRKDYENQGGAKWCVARGRVALYSMYPSPDIVTSFDFADVAGYGPRTWTQAAEDCLQKAAQKVERQLGSLTAAEVRR